MLRALALNISGRIVVVTRKDILSGAVSHCSNLIAQLPEEQGRMLRKKLCIIAEPCSRHTAPPVMLTLRFLERTDPAFSHSLLVCTSDHVISPQESFISSVEAASRQAESGKLVCFGIQPNTASTEYGYIKRGELISAEDEAYVIDFFKEKPDEDTARQYLAQGSYWWNSGMFGFSSVLFESELSRLSPAIYEAFPLAADCSFPQVSDCDGIAVIESWDSMNEAYQQTPAISIDMAIAEKTDKAVAVKAAFSWDDVGSWDSFERLFTQNSSQTVTVQSTNCFVYSDVPTVLCGVDDLIVVAKNGKVLVMKKGESHLVREAVKKVKQQTSSENVSK